MRCLLFNSEPKTWESGAICAILARCCVSDWHCMWICEDIETKKQTHQTVQFFCFFPNLQWIVLKDPDFHIIFSRSFSGHIQPSPRGNFLSNLRRKGNCVATTDENDAIKKVVCFSGFFGRCVQGCQEYGFGYDKLIWTVQMWSSM